MSHGRSIGWGLFYDSFSYKAIYGIFVWIDFGYHVKFRVSLDLSVRNRDQCYATKWKDHPMETGDESDMTIEMSQMFIPEFPDYDYL